MYAIIIFMVAGGCLALANRVEMGNWKTSNKEKIGSLLYSVMVGGIIDMLAKERDIPGFYMAVFAGSLLFACVTDIRCCEVFRFTWWIGCGSGICFLVTEILCRKEFPAGLLFLPLYIGLQEMLFSQTYGRADSHAFSACAIMQCTLKMNIEWYFLHMVLAFCCIIMVQAMQKNIGRWGILKRPVAFLPYITVSFWGMTAVWEKFYTDFYAL